MDRQRLGLPVRPATRFSIASAGVVAVGLAAWVFTSGRGAPPPLPNNPGHVRLPVRNPEIEAVESPVVGDPGPAVRARVLDDVEAVEGRELGLEAAAERRAIREQLIEARLRR